LILFLLKSVEYQFFNTKMYKKNSSKKLSSVFGVYRNNLNLTLFITPLN